MIGCLVLMTLAATGSLDVNTRVSDMSLQREGDNVTIIVGDQTYTPEDLFQSIDASHERPLALQAMNVSNWFGVAWFALGLSGQLVFSARLIVQWLASEKSKQSVVPNAFWWLSLGGAAMLILYFIWRRDAVGVLGQAFGFFVYIRNLYLIYYTRHPEKEVIA